MNPSCNCSNNITNGRIIDINRSGRHFTTINDANTAAIIRFNVPESTQIFDIWGKRMNFERLTPGMRVEVKHATFMTMSIPPQTTALVIKVLR